MSFDCYTTEYTQLLIVFSIKSDDISSVHKLYQNTHIILERVIA